MLGLEIANPLVNPRERVTVLEAAIDNKLTPIWDDIRTRPAMNGRDSHRRARRIAAQFLEHEHVECGCFYRVGPFFRIDSCVRSSTCDPNAITLDPAPPGDDGSRRTSWLEYQSEIRFPSMPLDQSSRANRTSFFIPI
jgi:hypothetical protein